jgi:PqqD family protein of HPr-rel-A system
MTPAWVRLVGAQFQWFSCEGEFLIFNNLSSETHFLDALSAAVLKGVADFPRTAAEISNELSMRFDLEEPLLEARVRDTLKQFEKLGLIETLNP